MPIPTVSKFHEAKEEEEETPEAPPPTYEASIASESDLYSDHDNHMVEASTRPSKNQDEPRTIYLPTSTTNSNLPIDPLHSTEKAIPSSLSQIQIQTIIPSHQPANDNPSDLPPPLPSRPPPLPSRPSPLPIRPSSIPPPKPSLHATYNLTWTWRDDCALFNHPTLCISPTGSGHGHGHNLPSSDLGKGNFRKSSSSSAYRDWAWQMRFETNSFARVYRCALEQAQAQDQLRSGIESCRVAEVQWLGSELCGEVSREGLEGAEIRFEHPRAYGEGEGVAGTGSSGRVEKMMMVRRKKMKMKMENPSSDNADGDLNSIGRGRREWELELPGGKKVEWINCVHPSPSPCPYPTATTNRLQTMDASNTQHANAHANTNTSKKTNPKKESKLTRAQKLGLKPGETHLITLGEVWDEWKAKQQQKQQKKKSSQQQQHHQQQQQKTSQSSYLWGLPNQETSALIDTDTDIQQHLIDSQSGQILAVFREPSHPRADNVAGVLEILMPMPVPVREEGMRNVNPDPDLEGIENLVIATAALVGMRNGEKISGSLGAGVGGAACRRWRWGWT